MSERTCIICATPLRPRQKLACSTPCRMKHYWTTPEGKESKARAQARYRQAKYGPPKRKPCATCGVRTTGDRCTTCRAREERATRRRDAARRRLDVAAVGKLGGRVWTMGRCHYCGDDLTTRSSSPARFCSDRCASLDKGARRRARGHDVWIAEVRRYAVFEQHDWTCHLCGEPIDQSLPPNDPMVGSLDHVIPLIGRGPHVESNLRPAHMMCNSLKSIEEHGQPCTA